MTSGKPPAAMNERPVSADASTANGETEHDSPHIKDLQRNIRNVAKKLNATAKVDAILAANPGISLEQLLASKKINSDQRAQALKKPSLQATLAQLEEQLAQFRKIDAEYQARLQSETARLTKAHRDEIEQLTSSSRQQAQSTTKQELRTSLLVFSQFLRAAAAKRLLEHEIDTEENKAFEGALLLVYGGDERAVDAAESLIRGSDEAVLSVEGQPLSITYAQIKLLAVEHAGLSEDTSEGHIDGPTAPDMDPTVAHAGLTEVDTAKQISNEMPDDRDQGLGPAIQGSAEDNMANATGSHGLPSTGNGISDLEESFEIVSRPRSETENKHEPGPRQQINSWADDATAAERRPVVRLSSDTTPATPPTDDGFHQVGGRRRGLQRQHSQQEHGRGGREHGRRGGRGGHDSGRGGARTGSRERRGLGRTGSRERHGHGRQGRGHEDRRGGRGGREAAEHGHGHGQGHGEHRRGQEERRPHAGHRGEGGSGRQGHTPPAA